MAIMEKETSKALDQAANKAFEQAAKSIDALAQRAKEAVYAVSRSDAGQDALDEFIGRRTGVWHIAHRARSQASEFAGQVYAQGRRGVSAVGHQVEERPLNAMLVVGLIGLVVGYMLRASR
jgi:ElaB/YqjD/DUF883 family membrane-anchored ribosome-binding protein